MSSTECEIKTFYTVYDSKNLQVNTYILYKKYDIKKFTRIHLQYLEMTKDQFFLDFDTNFQIRHTLCHFRPSLSRQHPPLSVV